MCVLDAELGKLLSHLAIEKDAILLSLYMLSYYGYSLQHGHKVCVISAKGRIKVNT